MSYQKASRPLLGLAVLVGLASCDTLRSWLVGPSPSASASAAGEKLEPLPPLEAKVRVAVGSAVLTGTTIPDDPDQADFWESCPPAHAAWKRARRLGEERRWKAAIAALELARRARPFAPQVLALSGYYELMDQDYVAAERELTVAVTVARNRAELAEAWYHLGVAYAGLEGKATPLSGPPKRGGDRERISWVIAERYGSKAATKKLGKSRHCTAEWEVLPALEAPLAAGWRQMYEEVEKLRVSLGGEPEPPSPLLATEPRRALCGPWPERDSREASCDGVPPFVLSLGYSMCHTHSVMIAPLPIGDWLYYGQGLDDDVRLNLPEVQGRVVVTRFDSARTTSLTVGDATLSAKGEWEALPPDGDWTNLPAGWDPGASLPARCAIDPSPLTDDDLAVHGAGCQSFNEAVVRVYGPTTVSLYEIPTRRTLLRARVWDGALNVTVEGDVLSVNGAGCSERRYLE
jgi:hypothetical protein